MSQIKIVNAQTGEEIIRDLTSNELADLRQAEQKGEERALAVAEAKAKRKALLARLGITEEEASLLAQSL